MAEMRARTKKGNVLSAPEDEEDNLVEIMDAKFKYLTTQTGPKTTALARGRKRLSFIL